MGSVIIVKTNNSTQTRGDRAADRNRLAHSLKRLNLDYVDLYQPCRIDLAIPVEETIGAVAELVKEGYVKQIGITQVEPETLRKANAVHPIGLLEMEYLLFNRGIENDILPVARELEIPVVGFGVPAHGLLAGTWTPERVQKAPADTSRCFSRRISKRTSP